MNGPHDLGGQMGFGPIAPEKDEPLFHAPWEKRALGITLCSGAMGHWTIDESRHARERLPPATYLSASYYEIWIRALETLLQRHGFVSAAELSSGVSQAGGTSPRRVLAAAEVPAMLARGAPCDRAIAQPPRFAVGDVVRTILMHPSGHTRLPRYAREKAGRVEALRGGFVFPDANAHGRGEAPEWLYTVVFEARTLWGKDADPKATVSIDAFESYLEPA